MANEPINPHDAFFKQFLSYPQVAADFLRRHLPAAVFVVRCENLRRLPLDDWRVP
jgi:predicted transposase YdaD